jgi:hypothetical protein
MKDVFVVGMDAFNREILETIEGCRFHKLFEPDEIVEPKGGRFPALEDLRIRARAAFEEVDGGPDAVIGYMDFPTAVLVPLLARDAGLPGPSLEAVTRCEHKYWSRLVQREAIPEMVPPFQAVDPFADDPLQQVQLDYPFWLKPVTAHSSFLGFRVDGDEAFLDALAEIREHIGVVGELLDDFLGHVDLPPEVRPVSGHHCIAEGLIGGDAQATLEGFEYNGEMQVFGVIDSIRAGEDRFSFGRYQYPSELPRDVKARMVRAGRELMRAFDYRGATFNIEFFWDSESDQLWLLEVNSRISRSHSPLFLLVDGSTNHEVVLDLAMGRKPDFPHQEGEYAIAGKFMMRVFKDEIGDGIVERCPSDDDIESVQRQFPGTRVGMYVENGTRLSELAFQDSASYELAIVYLGGDDEEELLERYEAVKQRLPFRIRPTDGKSSGRVVEPAT